MNSKSLFNHLLADSDQLFDAFYRFLALILIKFTLQPIKRLHLVACLGELISKRFKFKTNLINSDVTSLISKRKTMNKVYEVNFGSESRHVAHLRHNKVGVTVLRELQYLLWFEMTFFWDRIKLRNRADRSKCWPLFDRTLHWHNKTFSQVHNWR